MTEQPSSKKTRSTSTKNKAINRSSYSKKENVNYDNLKNIALKNFDFTEYTQNQRVQF